MGRLMISSLSLLILSGNLHAQNYSRHYQGHNAIFSLKAGYHTPIAYENTTGGFAFDFTGELHLGKGWYLGLNYDRWYADSKEAVDLEGPDYVNSGATPFLKYRYFSEKYAIYFAAGIGGNQLTISHLYGEEQVGFVNYNLRTGLDLFIERGIMASFEISHYAGAQIKFEGSGHVYRTFHFKVGLGYAFLQK
jgi:hypothetical protein